jgi:hypothetical protein
MYQRTSTPDTLWEIQNIDNINKNAVLLIVIYRMDFRSSGRLLMKVVILAFINFSAL